MEICFAQVCVRYCYSFICIIYLWKKRHYFIQKQKRPRSKYKIYNNIYINREVWSFRNKIYKEQFSLGSSKSWNAVVLIFKLFVPLTKLEFLSCFETNILRLPLVDEIKQIIIKVVYWMHLNIKSGSNLGK